MSPPPPPPVHVEWSTPTHHGPPSKLHGWTNRLAGTLTFDKRLKYRGQSEMDAARFREEHYRRNGWWPFRGAQRGAPGTYAAPGTAYAASTMPPGTYAATTVPPGTYAAHQQYASAPAAYGVDPYSAYPTQRRRWWPFGGRAQSEHHHHHHHDPYDEHEHEHGHGSHHGHSHGSHHGHSRERAHTHRAAPTYDDGHTAVYDVPGARIEVRRGGRRLSRSQSHPHRLHRSRSRSHSRGRGPEYYDTRLARYRTVHPDFRAAHTYRRHWGHPDHRCVPQYYGLWCLIKGYLTGNPALKHRGRMEREYAQRERRKERRRRWALFKAEMWARKHGHRTPFTI